MKEIAKIDKSKGNGLPQSERFAQFELQMEKAAKLRVFAAFSRFIILFT